MTTKTEAIALKSWAYSENKYIVAFYTKKNGVQRYFFRAHKKNNLLLQGLNQLEITLGNINAELKTIKSIAITEPYQQIPYDFYKKTMVLFLNELLYNSLREGEENIELYKFISNSLKALDLSENITYFHLYFMLKLSLFLGFYPRKMEREKSKYFDLIDGVFKNIAPKYNQYVAEKETELLYQLMTTKHYDLHTLSANKITRKQLLIKLLDYYKIHLEGFKSLKSLEILEMVIHN